MKVKLFNGVSWGRGRNIGILTDANVTLDFPSGAQGTPGIAAAVVRIAVVPKRSRRD